MEHSFWHKRWEVGQIGFHQHEINPYLQEYREHLPVGRILLPLCGKTTDMLWLAEQGYDVVGVELSQIAVDSFFREQQLPVIKEEIGSFIRYRSGRIEILCGDFFLLTAELVGEIEAVFDRAALIAMPPSLREAYVTHLTQILPIKVSILLVTISYPQSGRNGPPFAVLPAEVATLYQKDWRSRLLLDKQLPEQAVSWGLPELSEQIYLLQRGS